MPPHDVILGPRPLSVALAAAGAVTTTTDDFILPSTHNSELLAVTLHLRTAGVVRGEVIFEQGPGTAGIVLCSGWLHNDGTIQNHLSWDGVLPLQTSAQTFIRTTIVNGTPTTEDCLVSYLVGKR